MDNVINLMEQGYIPDKISRWGIRRLVGQRLRDESNNFIKDELNLKRQFFSQMKRGPIAVHTDAANEQHYEVPPQFFDLVLGDFRKYSGCYWGNDTKTLSQAEMASLSISCERAQIEDGMSILELGCGWGSLSLWLARNFPRCHITSVSNSSMQRKFIENISKEEGIENLTVISCDMNTFDSQYKFDRVMSIEMFEHMRNYQTLMNRIGSWLNPDGKLFIHIFCHQRFPYFFETDGSDNWMGRYFFTGGVMPSVDLPEYFQDDLNLETKWWWDGKHYQKTAEAWLQNMDQHKHRILKLFDEVYGESKSIRWFNRWRIFFMACAEMFGYKNGNEWGVSHYLFNKK
jgi:cyclopropane-fatty-acyl-phospholipid synthase